VSDRPVEPVDLDLRDLLEQVCPRLDKEAKSAYRAFCDMAIAGISLKKLAGRYQEIAHLISESYDATVEPPPTTSLATLGKWSRKYQWQQRIKLWQPVYATYNRRLDAEREKMLIGEWNRFRKESLPRIAGVLEKADLMLKHPHVERVVKRQVTADYAGQVIEQEILITPTQWRMRDIAAFYKTSRDWMRDVVGDRQIMIDTLIADGFVITDPTGHIVQSNPALDDYLRTIDSLPAAEDEGYEE
jgi:hypothetical protein